MIMGFDSDDTTIFDRQIEFIQKARIPYSMSGMLYAIPKTPLYDRLAEEGRLDFDDRPECGTNVIPLQMTREELRDGYLRVLREQYDTETYFDRTEALFLDPKYEVGYGGSPYWRRHPLRWLRVESLSLVAAIGLFVRLMRHVPDPALRREYRRRLGRLLKVHRRPGLILFYLLHMTMHFHTYTMARQMNSGQRAIVNSY